MEKGSLLFLWGTGRAVIMIIVYQAGLLVNKEVNARQMSADLGKLQDERVVVLTRSIGASLLGIGLHDHTHTAGSHLGGGEDNVLQLELHLLVVAVDGGQRDVLDRLQDTSNDLLRITDQLGLQHRATVLVVEDILTQLVEISSQVLDSVVSLQGLVDVDHLATEDIDLLTVGTI